MKITYKFRLYPSAEEEKRLSFVLEIFMLYNNLKVLKELKKKGKKVGKLRYKKYMQSSCEGITEGLWRWDLYG